MANWHLPLSYHYFKQKCVKPTILKYLKAWDTNLRNIITFDFSKCGKVLLFEEYYLYNVSFTIPEERQQPQMVFEQAAFVDLQSATYAGS